MSHESSTASSARIKGIRSLLRILARFLPHLRPIWDKVLLRIILTQCGAFLGVCSIMASADIIDRALPSKSPRLLMLWMAFLLVLSGSGMLFGFVGGVIGNYITLWLDIRFKNLMLRHIQRLSLRFFDSRPIGEHMFRIGSDTSETAGLIGGVIPTMIDRVQAILMALGVMLMVSPKIVGLLALYIALYYTYAHFVGSMARDAQRALRVRSQEFSAMLQQNLSNFTLARVCAREGGNILRYFRHAAFVMRASIRWAISLAFFNTGVALMENWFFPLAHWLFCGTLVIQGALTVGEYVALGAMITQLTLPLEHFTVFIQIMRIQAVPAERMLETLNVPPEITMVPRPIRLKQPRGEIVFENVSFRYSPEGPEVLKNLSFRLPAGCKLAIVGLSGAGKTTVFNLLMRYYDPTEGRILVDGHDLRQLELSTYYDQVGLVLQDNFLFSATLRDNLLFGRPGATEADLAEAVTLAGLDQAHEVVADGLDTVLEEGGNLSAGQKQRMAIARAVIRNPQFLFLDEATCSLDPITEREILGQLRTVEQ